MLQLLKKKKFYEQETSGYVLLHFIIAWALLVIILGISVGAFKSFKYYLIRVELEKLYSLFFCMQQQAIALHKPQEIVFMSKLNAYQAGTQKENLCKELCFGFLSGAHGPPSDPKRLITKAITFPGEKVHFYPDGTISAGTIYLTDTEKTVMYALTSGIAQVPFMRQYRYDGKQWVLLS